MPTMPWEEDRTLARRCLAGEPGAWENLVGRTTPPLRRFAARTLSRYGLPCGDGEVADLVQAALAALLDREQASLKAYAGQSSLTTYACAILLGQARKAAGGRRLLPLEAGAGEASAALSPLEALERRERTDACRTALEGLPPRDRLVLSLVIQGASPSEIASVLGVPPSHARTLLTRARAKARELLEKSTRRP